MADNCLFCRIVRKEIPAKIVAETEDCVAFRDVNPQAPVHILVVPRVHVPSVKEVTDPLLVGKLTDLAKDLAQREGVADDGYRLVINTNSDAGQTVFHLHVHLLGGRHMTWPPG
ncbi:MAG TPA: histidine triad nucleotide-binding protein [Gemmatimonadaceae bacterium]